jgi:thiamine pyrophosphate-dependent acetolactate synthase large subunit-like protein
MVDQLGRGLALETEDAAIGVIVIGFRFTQIDTHNWTTKLPDNIVQIDRDRTELGREYPITAGVSGGLAPAVKALCDELEWMLPEHDADWSAVARATHVSMVESFGCWVTIAR